VVVISHKSIEKYQECSQFTDNIPMAQIIENKRRWYRTLVSKNYFVFVALMILLVAGLLGWIANARMEAFHQHHLDITSESIKGVETQVAHYVAEKRRMVELFAEEHIDTIRALASNPDNDEINERLGNLLTRYFPDKFAFTIADNLGEPLFEDFDGLVSQMCLSDVEKFSVAEDNYHPYIHPNSEGYHFDIMVHYGDKDEQGGSNNRKEGIFFVSFLADVLGNIISSAQNPNHQLMLILPQRNATTSNDLIEVVAGGARNLWARDDYRLSVKERDRIEMRQNIEGTRWQVIEYHDPKIRLTYKNKPIVESAIVFLVFITIAILLIVRLHREERQRKYAEEERRALMGVVSHEFRSPVSIVKSALDLISEGDAGEINAEVKEYIDIASNNTSRLLLLVNDFLEIEKIEAGKLHFDMRESQLSLLVAKVVDRNKLYAEQLSARYELLEPLAGDHVSCDEHRMELVLSNLLSNAAKYGGKNDSIEVAVTRNAEQLRVSVSDHGPGIPKEYHSHVFEKFAMAHAPKPKEETNEYQAVQSSGLGLSIAKAIIEHHGGTIGFETRTDVESETGTTFWFELPVVGASC
jgi:signal transduction histidine kinase